MLYLFDKSTLQFKSLRRKWIGYLLGYTTVVLSFGFFLGLTTDNKIIVESEKIPIILSDDTEFSEEALLDLLNDLGVRFPYIVMAQARVETGHYSSWVRLRIGIFIIIFNI